MTNNFVVFVRINSQKSSDSKLLYEKAFYRCSRRPCRQSQGRGIRRSYTRCTGCPARFHVHRYNDHLMLTAHYLEHHHPRGKFIYDRLPVNRRLTNEELKECSTLLKYGAPSSEIRQYVADHFGKDVYNYPVKCQPPLLSRFHVRRYNDHLMVTSYYLEHNHPRSKFIFDSLPVNRGLATEELNECSTILKHGAPSLEIRQYVADHFGKVLTIQDVYNYRVKFPTPFVSRYFNRGKHPAPSTTVAQSCAIHVRNTTYRDQCRFPCLIQNCTNLPEWLLKVKMDVRTVTAVQLANLRTVKYRVHQVTTDSDSNTLPVGTESLLNALLDTPNEGCILLTSWVDNLIGLFKKRSDVGPIEHLEVHQEMGELVAGEELLKGLYEELVIFRSTRGATVYHAEKDRIGLAQRDLNPQRIAKWCTSDTSEDNRDGQGRNYQEMGELVAGEELLKGLYEELVIFRSTRGATVYHAEKDRIGLAQRDLNPQRIAKWCTSDTSEDNRDGQGRNYGSERWVAAPRSVPFAGYSMRLVSTEDYTVKLTISFLIWQIVRGLVDFSHFSFVFPWTSESFAISVANRGKRDFPGGCCRGPERRLRPPSKGPREAGDWQFQIVSGCRVLEAFPDVESSSEVVTWVRISELRLYCLLRKQTMFVISTTFNSPALSNHNPDIACQWQRARSLLHCKCFCGFARSAQPFPHPEIPASDVHLHTPSPNSSQMMTSTFSMLYLASEADNRQALYPYHSTGLNVQQRGIGVPPRFRLDYCKLFGELDHFVLQALRWRITPSSCDCCVANDASASSRAVCASSSTLNWPVALAKLNWEPSAGYTFAELVRQQLRAPHSVQYRQSPIQRLLQAGEEHGPSDIIPVISLLAVIGFFSEVALYREMAYNCFVPEKECLVFVLPKHMNRNEKM
ncbi:hypothetical protein CLF_101157 [Clonorchis sinensis]|uniref:Uncharacterized protein n=1 Tax=Clonorchis sinensis TaxID=79923 RepID=G7Y557_CLOSI|nr:hypothetical protein CLF_101157 [Clonorchis sinensis]